MEQPNAAPESAGNVSMNIERVLENVIALSTAIETLDEALQERAQPYAERMKLLQEEMDRDLFELRAQADKLKTELQEDKLLLQNNWPGESGRVKHQGWTIDRKERRGAEVLSEEMLVTRCLARVAWDKQPFRVSWNHTKLAKLIETGVIDETIARPTMSVSISVTPPKLRYCHACHMTFDAEPGKHITKWHAEEVHDSDSMIKFEERHITEA